MRTNVTINNKTTTKSSSWLPSIGQIVNYKPGNKLSRKGLKASVAMRIEGSSQDDRSGHLKFTLLDSGKVIRVSKSQAQKMVSSKNITPLDSGVNVTLSPTA